jgi:regulator of sirC expression with transglutaminase-like and TPR domain
MRSAILEQLRAFGGVADADLPLAETALLLAAVDHPEVDLTPYRAHLRALAEAAARTARATDGVERQAAALAEVIAGSFGYRGDAETYNDARNANLIDVIDRRKGLPVALGILYLHACRAYGGKASGLGFPSHFLIRLDARGQRAILDPFHRGRMLDAAGLRRLLKELHGQEAEMAPDHYAEIGNRDILIRLQNNLKLRAIAAGNLMRAADLLETMTLFAPERSELSWELAVIESRIGQVERAIATLERFLANRPAADGRAELEELLSRLRSRLP